MLNTVKAVKTDISALSHEQLSLLHALLKQTIDDNQIGSGEQLLAYYSLAGKQALQINNNELRNMAKVMLPEHMVPDLFVPIEKIPRLANGKADIHKLPYVVVKRSNSSNSLAGSTREFDVVAGLLGELLALDEIRPDDNFFELGGDSITAIRLVSRVREAGIPVDVKAITSDRTLGEIAAEASQRLKDASAGSVSKNSVDEQVAPFGEMPLTPIQRWFFAQQHPQPEHWNLAGAIEISSSLNIDKLRRCVLDSVAAHPVIGMAFKQYDSEWKGYIPDQTPPVELVQELSADAFEYVTRETLIIDLQKSFSLSDGWLVRFALVNDIDNKHTTILWVCHHLIMDVLSLSAFFIEVQKRYIHGIAPVTTGCSYREWAFCLFQHAQSRAESGRSVSRDLFESARLNEQVVDRLCESDCISRQLISSEITSRETYTDTGSLLEILLACLAGALSVELQLDELRIDIEHHGRDLLDEVDVTDSVGWFTSYFPCYLKTGGSGDVRDIFPVVKSALLRAQQKEAFYLVDRYFNSVEDSARQSPSVLFNFQGVQSGSAEGVWESSYFHWDSLRSKNNSRSHDIEINAAVSLNGLELNWRYAASRFSDEFFDKLEDKFRDNLQNVLADFENVLQHAVSDHQELDLSQRELDDFLDSLE